MKLNPILLALATAFMLIGIYETFVHGIQLSYWAFMISIALLIWIKQRKKKEEEDTEEPSSDALKRKPTQKKSIAQRLRKK